MSEQQRKEKEQRLKWVESYSMMRNKINLLKKDIQNVVTNQRLSEFRTELNDLFKSEREQLIQDEREKSRIQSSLEGMKSSVFELQSIIRDSNKVTSDESREKLIDKLRSLMNAIENDIHQFKEAEKEKCAILTADEKILDKDLSQFSEKMENWDKEEEESYAFTNHKKMKKIQEMNKMRLDEEKVPVQVIDYENFVKETGITGGWDDRDHAMFLRIRAKVKGNTELLIAQAASTIPNQTLLTVQDHEDWYCKMLTLTERKKVAIQQWRKEKEKEKLDQFEIEQHHNLKKVEEYEEAKRQKLEKWRIQNKERLEAWKEQKDKEQQREEERERLKEEMERQRREWETQQRKVEMKEALDEYKREKEERRRQEQLEQEQREMNNKNVRPLSPGEIERRWQKDSEYIQRMIELKVKKAEEEQEKEERMRRIANKIRVTAERDFSRVLRPTSATKNRLKEFRLEGADNKAQKHNFDIRQVQHRVIPAWMK